MSLIDDIIARIQAIESRLGGTTTTTPPSNYEQLMAQVQSLSATVNNIQAQQQQYASAIQSLQSQINQIKATLSSLPSPSQISSLTSQVNSLSSAVSQIQATLSSLSNLPATVQGLVSTVQSLQNQLQSLSNTVAQCCGTKPPSVTKYSCVNGSCVLDPNGQYSSLTDCMANCKPSPPPITKYSCINGSCVQDPNGQYLSLTDCMANCKPSPPPPPPIQITIDTGASPLMGGTVAPSSATLTQTLTSQTFTAYPNQGYQIDHWELDGITLANSQGQNAIMLTLDNLKNAGITSGTHKLVAVFKQIQQAVSITINASASPSTAGTVAPSSATLTQTLTSQTFTAYPNQGYQIDHWELDGITLANSQGQNAIMLTLDNLKNAGITSGTHKLVAVFKQIQQTVSTYITITASDGGAVTPQGTFDLSTIDNLIKSGKIPNIISVSSSVPSCYTFDHWDLNGANIGTSPSIGWDILKNASNLKIGSNNVLTAMFRMTTLCNNMPVPKQYLCVSSALGTKMLPWTYAQIPFGAIPNVIPLTIKVHYPGSDKAPEECITGNGVVGSRVVTFAAPDGAYFQATCSNGYKFSGKYSSNSLDSGTQYKPPSGTAQTAPMQPSAI